MLNSDGLDRKGGEASPSGYCACCAGAWPCAWPCAWLCACGDASVCSRSFGVAPWLDIDDVSGRGTSATLGLLSVNRNTFIKILKGNTWNEYTIVVIGLR